MKANRFLLVAVLIAVQLLSFNALAQRSSTLIRLPGKYLSEQDLFVPLDSTFWVEQGRNGYARFCSRDDLPRNGRISSCRRTGLIDSTGRILLTPNYLSISGFNNGLCLYSGFKESGYIDKNGEKRFVNEYASISTFRYGMASVSNRDGKYGIIDTRGKEILPFKYSNIRYGSTGSLLVFDEGLHGVLDSNGKMIIPVEYDDIRAHYAEHISVKKDGKWGVVDRKHKVVLPIEFEHEVISVPELSVYIMVNRDEYSVWDFKSRELLFDSLNSASYHPLMGLLQVYKNGKWGYMDREGNYVIPLELKTGIYQFNHGLAVYKIAGEGCGFIRQNGKRLTEPEYLEAYPFFNGLSKVYTKDMKHGFVDTTGKLVFVLEAAGLEHFSNDRALIYKNGKRGFLDRNGEMVIPLKYKYAYGFWKGLALVTEDGENWYYIDTEGNRLN